MLVQGHGTIGAMPCDHHISAGFDDMPVLAGLCQAGWDMMVASIRELKQSFWFAGSATRCASPILVGCASSARAPVL